jgi:TolB-like protein/DNA-binding winged helix-turn-helix (wHTH) protein
MGAGSGYRFGEFILNLDRGCLQKGGADLALRPKAFEVLRYLVEHAGRLATKDELVQAVWPNVFVSDDALAHCVRDVRKVLNDDRERFIKTVPRRGYMFVADTAPVVAGEGPSLAGATAAPPAGRNLAETSWLGRSRFGGLPLAIAAAAAFIVLVAVAAVSTRGWFGGPPPATDARLTIAVLAFTTLAEKPGEDWLGDGIAEDIMTAVSRFRDLTVIGRSSSFRYRGDAIDVRRAAKELGAHYLLQGSVRRSGNRLRITVELVDPRTGASRWSERYDRPFADVFAIQDDIADKVAVQLVARAQEATIARVRTRAPADLEVYELVLRARKAHQSFKREGMLESRSLSERAIAIDPSYASAWAALSRALQQLYIQPYSEHHGTLAIRQQARTAAEKAASLDVDSATAQAVLGFSLVWGREHEAGLDAFRRAIVLNPNDSTAWVGYAQALSYAGLNREALDVWERSQHLNPFFPGPSFGIRAKPHIMLREFEPAYRLARSCAERTPTHYHCFVFLAIAAKESGREEEARGAARRILELYPKFTIKRHMDVAPFRKETDAAQFTGYLRGIGLPE